MRPPEKSSGNCGHHDRTLELSKLFFAKASTILDTCPGAEVEAFDLLSENREADSTGTGEDSVGWL